MNNHSPDIQLEDIDNNTYSLKSLNSQWLLIINTASACGFTPQIQELIDQQEKIDSLNLKVILMPSNDFNQEPLSIKDMKKKYTFRKNDPYIVCKPCIVNGPKQHPLYRHLTNENRGVFMQKRIIWNFTKFILSPHQKHVRRLATVRSIANTLGVVAQMQTQLEAKK